MFRRLFVCLLFCSQLTEVCQILHIILVTFERVGVAVITVLGKHQESPDVLRELPHETCSVQVERDVGFVARVEENRAFGLRFLVACPILVAHEHSLLVGSGAVGPREVVNQAVVVKLAAHVNHGLVKSISFR